ncbi:MULTISPECIES: cbb3-type cytochrome oxidase assembly protein CcoS [Niastella]|uniref:Cbb3-type cytochrome oxidase assembly protein CcoS n=1 Tax=Niastella soli TaxID=2821487 RepID=A0ABS3YVE5_9BACT|nr:cbb3-type cytochrome oxidase assembly protein CcoS [Niastella soli]MBO9201904.1 cbb3-type cytochrome oxidase assembly protein CcoS [Niastella soli]
MSAIVILLIASISVSAIFLAAFIWSVRSGQYDDDFSPPQRILFDNQTNTPLSDNNSKQKAEL